MATASAVAALRGLAGVALLVTGGTCFAMHGMLTYFGILHCIVCGSLIGHGFSAPHPAICAAAGTGAMRAVATI
ncbi:MAG: DUF1624 domain-containing protein [Rhodobacteraceae bacterium]|nr:DUF1624 domain-containing protein [Paracoccaceae bacterium]